MKPGKGWKRGYKACGWDFDPVTHKGTFTSAIGGLGYSSTARYALGEITYPPKDCGPLAVFARYHDAVAFMCDFACVLCTCWYKPYSGLATQPEGIDAPRTKPRLWQRNRADELLITMDHNFLPTGTRFADAVRLESVVAPSTLERSVAVLSKDYDARMPSGILRHCYASYCDAFTGLSHEHHAVARLARYASELELQYFGVSLPFSAFADIEKGDGSCDL